jgi:hypothetical protein
MNISVFNPINGNSISVSAVYLRRLHVVKPDVVGAAGIGFSEKRIAVETPA